MGYQYTNPESGWVNASQSKFWQNTPIMKSMQLCRFQIAEESLQWSCTNPRCRVGKVRQKSICWTYFFIMPGQKIRQDSVRKKLNPIPHEFAGKRVFSWMIASFVEIRLGKLYNSLAMWVPKKYSLPKSAAPPMLYPNVYGIDMPAKQEYIAHGKTNQEITEAIGADWLTISNFRGPKAAVIDAGGGRVTQFYFLLHWKLCVRDHHNGVSRCSRIHSK